MNQAVVWKTYFNAVYGKRIDMTIRQRYLKSCDWNVIFATLSIGMGLSITDAKAAQYQKNNSKHAGKNASNHQQPATPPTGITAPQQTPEHINVSMSHAQSGGGRLPPKNIAAGYSSVTRDYIAMQSPQGSVLQLAQTMPGANVAQGDPYGVTNNTNMTVRGMNSTEIAFLADGTPQNASDGSTVSPAQLVDNENVQSVTLTQGASDISVPSASSVGGVFSFSTIEPTDKFGGYIEDMIGTYHAYKEFIRLNTGQIGKTGIKGWVSFSSFHDKHFNGPGIDNRFHLDSKFVKEWGDGNRISLVASWSQNNLAQYYNPTQAQFKENGLSNYYSPTFNPNGTPSEMASYWQNQRNNWDNYNFGIPISLKITHNIRFDSEPYFWTGRGNVTYGDVLPTNGSYLGSQYVAQSLSLPYAQNGEAPVVARYNFTPQRIGQNSYLTFKTKYNSVKLGYWYEDDMNRNYIDYTALGSTGIGQNLWLDPRFSVRYPDGRKLYGLNWALRTQINAIYLKDDVSLFHDRLKLGAGIKVVMMHRDGYNRLPGSQGAITQNLVQPLPQVNGSFKIDARNQIFFDGSTGFRAPTGSSFFNAYNSGTGALSTLGTANQKSEFSIKEEIGFRHQNDIVNGSVTFFNYNFTNRQVSTLENIDGALVSTAVNVGGVTARGVDLELATRPFWHFSPYASFEYINAHLDNNFRVGNNYLPTAGKTAVMTPKFTAAFGLSYSDRQFFGSFDLKYMSSQYSSIMDDEKMPHVLYANMGLGYRIPDFSFLKGPKFQVNFVNLGASKYLSGVSSITTNSKSHMGLNGTEIAASSPANYYIGPAFTAAFSLSTGF